MLAEAERAQKAAEDQATRDRAAASTATSAASTSGAPRPAEAKEQRKKRKRLARKARELKHQKTAAAAATARGVMTTNLTVEAVSNAAKKADQARAAAAAATESRQCDTKRRSSSSTDVPRALTAAQRHTGCTNFIREHLSQRAVPSRACARSAARSAAALKDLLARCDAITNKVSGGRGTSPGRHCLSGGGKREEERIEEGKR